MCAKHKPAIVTLENVDSLKDESASSSGQSNLDVVLQMFKDAGFDMQCYRMAATDYGLPQNRIRLKFVGYQEESSLFHRSEGAETFATVARILMKSKCCAPCSCRF